MLSSHFLVLWGASPANTSVAAKTLKLLIQAQRATIVLDCSTYPVMRVTFLMIHSVSCKRNIQKIKENGNCRESVKAGLYRM